MNRPRKFRQHVRTNGSQPTGIWVTAVLTLFGLVGCAALHPLDGLPARYLPDQYRAPRRSGRKTIDLSLLAQTPPKEYLVDSGDVLGVYIPTLFGRRDQAPPVHFPQKDEDSEPAMGYPIPVRDDGTISLPFVGAVYVRGLTLRQVEQRILQALVEDQHILNKETAHVFVSLQKPRVYRVLVIRQEGGLTENQISGAQGEFNLGALKRGTGRLVTLPAYRNDVLHALVETGGLPGLDAENTIYIIRNRRRLSPQAAPADSSPPTPASTNTNSNSRPGTKASTPTASSNLSFSTPQPFGTFPNSSAAQPTATTPYNYIQSNNIQPNPLNSQPANASSSWNVPAGWSRSASRRFDSYRQTASPAVLWRGQSPLNNGWNSWNNYRAVPVSWNTNSPNAPAASTTPSNSAFPTTAQPPHWQPVSLAQPPAGFDWLNDQTIENPRIIRIPVRLAPGEHVHFTEKDIILGDGDIVFIESRETEVFYTGGLLGGGQYTLPRDYDLDVLGAVSIALSRSGNQSNVNHGIGGPAALNQDVSVGASQVIILRQLPNGTQLPIKVDLYKAMRDPAERVLIQPGDYVILQYTPLEAVAAFFQRYILEGAVFGVAASQIND